MIKHQKITALLL